MCHPVSNRRGTQFGANDSGDPACRRTINRRRDGARDIDENRGRCGEKAWTPPYPWDRPGGGHQLLGKRPRGVGSLNRFRRLAQSGGPSKEGLASGRATLWVRRLPSFMQTKLSRAQSQFHIDAHAGHNLVPATVIGRERGSSIRDRPFLRSYAGLGLRCKSPDLHQANPTVEWLSPHFHQSCLRPPLSWSRDRAWTCRRKPQIAVELCCSF